MDRFATILLPLAIVGNKTQMRGSLTADRRWFGVGQGQSAGTDAVAAHVRVDIAVDANR